jgi:hypothetical protein
MMYYIITFSNLYYESIYRHASIQHQVTVARPTHSTRSQKHDSLTPVCSIGSSRAPYFDRL